jgi:hypothetical protein
MPVLFCAVCRICFSVVIGIVVIEVLRLFWATPERGITFDGDHVRLGGVKAGPPPAHDIAIWIGGYGPRMLELIGRLADGWLPSSPYLPPERLPAAQQRIDDAAKAAGRDPSAIRRPAWQRVPPGRVHKTVRRQPRQGGRRIPRRRP